MQYEAVLTPTRHDETTVPLKVEWTLWTRILKAAMAGGGLQLEVWSSGEARQFSAALAAVLEPPAPKPAALPRYAVFKPVVDDPGRPLRDPAVRPVVEQVVALFAGSGVRVERAPTSSLRAYSRHVPDDGAVAAPDPRGFDLSQFVMNKAVGVDSR